MISTVERMFSGLFNKADALLLVALMLALTCIILNEMLLAWIFIAIELLATVWSIWIDRRRRKEREEANGSPEQTG